MNPGIVIKLRPTGPWRIGPDSGARNRVDAVLHSDSLFGAVTWAMTRMGSLEAWLDATVRSSTPAVSFSSCFPFLDEIGFVIPPRTVWPPSSPGLMSARVRWKSARFVPLGIVQAILSGQRLDPNHWQVDGPSECLLPAGRPGPFVTSVRWSAAVDRLTGAADRHSIACIEFRPGAGLWTIASFADDAARDRWQPEVMAAFRVLADSGFGGERSRGWGRSEAPEFLEGVLPDMLMGPPEPPKMAAEGEGPGGGGEGEEEKPEVEVTTPAPEIEITTPAPDEEVATPAPEIPPVVPEELGAPAEAVKAAEAELPAPVPSPEAEVAASSETAVEAAAVEEVAPAEAELPAPVPSPEAEVVASSEATGEAAPAEAALASWDAEGGAEAPRRLKPAPQATAEEHAPTPEAEVAPAPQAAAEEHAPTPEPEIEAPPPVPSGLHGYWLLSLYTPAADDTVDWQRGNYTVAPRGGRVDSPAGSGELKKQQQMVTEGSVLYAATDPRGSATNVAPDGFPHPVLRSGFAVAIRLPEVR